MGKVRTVLAELPEKAFIDFLEGSAAYLYVIDVPGATSETTEVAVVDGKLAVRAGRDDAVPADFEARRTDRSDRLEYDLPIPEDAVGADATGSVENGVLEIELPKTHEHAKQIDVIESEAG